MVGGIENWSGLAEGSSWLIDHAKSMGFNAMWFSPFNQTTSIEKTVHGQKVTGSYYAIKDHFSLDTEFSTDNKAQDLHHLRSFCTRAQEQGVRVYADLVFNHVAADHPLVTEENAAIAQVLRTVSSAIRPIIGHKDKVIGMRWSEDGVEKNFHFKFRRKSDFSLSVGGPPEDPWSDVAEINYSSPAARRFFVEGDGNKKGYFKQVIDWCMDLGFTAFRCDAAYMIPPETWQNLIGYARAQKDDLIFLAETLCTDASKVERLSRATIPDGKGGERPAFDFGMLGFYWWDFKHDWLPKSEHPRIQSMSRYGGAGAPDNHDTQETLAGCFTQQGFAAEARAAISVRNYAISALASTSFYMQMGFEYCNEKQNRVFKGLVTTDDWDYMVSNRAGKSVLDIRPQISAINDLKDRLNVENCRVHFKEYSPIADHQAVKIHVEYIDVDSGDKKAEVVLLVNNKPEHGAITLSTHISDDMKKDGFVSAQTSSNPPLKDVLIYHTPLSEKPRRTVKPISAAASNLHA